MESSSRGFRVADLTESSRDWAGGHSGMTGADLRQLPTSHDTLAAVHLPSDQQTPQFTQTSTGDRRVTADVVIEYLISA